MVEGSQGLDRYPAYLRHAKDASVAGKGPSMSESVGWEGSESGQADERQIS